MILKEQKVIILKEKKVIIILIQYFSMTGIIFTGRNDIEISRRIPYLPLFLDRR
jgi:hypothetical protein